MKSKMLVIMCVLVLCFGLVFPVFAADGNKDDGTGYVLLETLMTKLLELVRPGSKPGNMETLVPQLAERVDKAYQEKKIDAVFFFRYKKILSIIKLSSIKDPRFLLWPMVRETMTAFIQGIEGKKPGETLKKMYFDHGGTLGLGVIMGAVVNEVLNLHIYLDTRAKRQEILKGYLKKK